MSANTSAGKTDAMRAATLLERLRTATWPLHRAVERAGIMPALLRGALPVATYAALLGNLKTIYAALEAGLLQHGADPRIGPVCRPALFRHAALEADMAWLTATHPALADRSHVSVTAAQAYSDRLQTLAADAPVALVAHAYVRYLGDLNGGQSLGRTVQRMLGSAHGAHFYDFGNAAEVTLQTAALREALGALPLTPPEAEAVVAEAQWAFRQHGLLFEALAVQLPAAVDAGPMPGAGVVPLSA
jgi:heme oxygenase (biliverdin-producing, ferredoxin)